MKYRKLRVQDLLREEISSIIHRELKDPRVGFTTVVEVRMTEDLKIAKVYCSVYGAEEVKKETMETLKRSRGFIKHLLGERVRLRYTPDLVFILDDTADKAARIEEILQRTKGVPGNQEDH